MINCEKVSFLAKMFFYENYKGFSLFVFDREEGVVGLIYFYVFLLKLVLIKKLTIISFNNSMVVMGESQTLFGKLYFRKGSRIMW